MQLVRLVIVCAVVAFLIACSRPRSTLQPARTEADRSSSSKQRVQALRARENALRARYSPNEAPAWVDVSGADPYRLAPVRSEPQLDRYVPDGKRAERFVGILRGSKALVTLDAQLHERERIPLAETPTALCVSSSREALVGSRFSPVIQRIGLGSPAKPIGEFRVDASGVSDLACGEHGLLHVLTSDPPALLTLDAHGKLRAQSPALPGGLRLLERGGYLLESSLFDRSLRISKLDGGVPSGELARIRHDGPIWAFDALVTRGELWLALSGVEDKPLVRGRGEFENIDSFVWLYRYGPRGLEQVATLDVGEQGLILPKAVALTEQNGELRLAALAAGSGVLLRAHFDRGLAALVPVQVELVPPGASDAVFLGAGDVAYASPLLDAWVMRDAKTIAVRHVDPQRRPEPLVRLGEALFFTNLMAPQNVSSGTHSRFTCETCHFEGGVDGRTHYTGRADVSVVTKPLFGLANNRPHFSRAKDRDLSSVCHNEFRVAGAGSGTDPWFSVQSARFPWLAELGITRGELSALDLREALLQFLYAFSHAPNPRVRGRARFSELEARGARAFEARCEGCHSARLLSDDASSRLPASAWEEAIFRRNAPLVWARAEYEKTGVMPYVDEQGTRITSLRRLASKPRYFTNGSAATLDDVLARFRSGVHHTPEQRDLVALDEAERRALLAFLVLL